MSGRDIDKSRGKKEKKSYSSKSFGGSLKKKNFVFLSIEFVLLGGGATDFCVHLFLFFLLVEGTVSCGHFGRISSVVIFKSRRE
jgi:hypothetical protein